MQGIFPNTILNDHMSNKDNESEKVFYSTIVMQPLQLLMLLHIKWDIGLGAGTPSWHTSPSIMQ